MGLMYILKREEELENELSRAREELEDLKISAESKAMRVQRLEHSLELIRVDLKTYTTKL